MRWETSYLHDDFLRRVGRPQVCNHLRWCQSVESSVDDLRTGRGVVLGRAVPMLRSVETQPLTGGFVLMAGRIPPKNLKSLYLRFFPNFIFLFFIKNFLKSTLTFLSLFFYQKFSISHCTPFSSISFESPVLFYLIFL